MTETHELVLQPGLIVNQEFFDNSAMQESAKNWLYMSKYRFGTGGFYGRHDGIQLNNMQFGHAVRHEGMMLQGFSPKGCLSIIILQKNMGKICINQLKLETGDIIIIDDSKPYDFNSSHHSMMAIISVSKSLLINRAPHLLHVIDTKLEDTDKILSRTIEREWQSILDNPKLYQNIIDVDLLESRVLVAIEKVFEGQVGETTQLTKGEITALEIKDFLLSSLNENITIESLVEQFDISYKTLENSFNSLFDMTPKHFLTLLKLNHAHEDLLNLPLDTTSIADIAVKWGFSHFGRFAEKHKALFGVLPSEVIRKC